MSPNEFRPTYNVIAEVRNQYSELLGVIVLSPPLRFHRLSKVLLHLKRETAQYRACAAHYEPSHIHPYGRHALRTTEGGARLGVEVPTLYTTSNSYNISPADSMRIMQEANTIAREYRQARSFELERNAVLLSAFQKTTSSQRRPTQLLNQPGLGYIRALSSPEAPVWLGDMRHNRNRSIRRW